MTVKQSVLQALETHRGESLSGEALAQLLGVSRASIWKAIKALQQEGYTISAVTNRGYCLQEAPDRLTAAGIAPFLTDACEGLDLLVVDEIDSTNLEAKRLALQGKTRCVVIADRQSAGRGRLGRSFFSPPGCGIYCSLLLRPDPSQMQDITLLTVATAVAVSRAIERTTGLSPAIKWVNDLYLGERKICGILTEAVTDMESGQIESVVIGFGVNFRTAQALPEELQTIAGSIFGEGTPSISRNTLAAAMLNELLPLATTLSSRSFLPEYRSRSMLLGREIVFSQGGVLHDAIAHAIDENGALVVRLPDQSLVTLRSGEVSVRTADRAQEIANR